MSPIWSRFCTLGGNQSQEQLVIAAEQTRRVDQVRMIDGVQNILHGYVSAEHPGGIRA